MLKHIIFDIGTVLMSFQPKEYYRPFFPDEKHCMILCQKVFGHLIWENYDQGVFLLADVRKAYAQEYPEDVEDIERMLKDWMDLMKPMKESIAFLKEMKAEGYGIYLFSNISKDSADYLKEQQDFFSFADGAVLSYEEQRIKPDPILYHILFTRYGLQPEECLYLDDNEKNIIQGRLLGMQTVLMKDAQEGIKEARNRLKKEVSYAEG